jgi:hypothetical protein
MMMSVEATTPEFPSAAPVLKLTETGELGHGGIGPLSTAEIVAPGLTLDPNAGVQTVVTACAGAVIKGATQTPIVAMQASCRGKVIRKKFLTKTTPPQNFLSTTILRPKRIPL